MDSSKVELVTKYALALAAKAEVPWQRGLGRIHLLKYVYLADIAFAEWNDGRAFTETEWRFHHYGPWSYPAMAAIESIVALLPAEQIRVSSPKYENDSLYWALAVERADEIEREAERLLPTSVTSALKAALKNCGSDTRALLQHVYATTPMRHAAPEDVLDLSLARRPPAQEELSLATSSRKEEKRRDASLRELRHQVQKKIAELRSGRSAAATRPPRYDEVYATGKRWLDELTDLENTKTDGELEFHPDVWKSPWRTDPGH